MYAVLKCFEMLRTYIVQIQPRKRVLDDADYQVCRTDGTMSYIIQIIQIIQIRDLSGLEDDRESTVGIYVRGVQGLNTICFKVA